MDCKKTGAFIAALRKEAGLTQVQLAERLGVTGGAVSKWERGLCYPDIELVARLAEELSVSANEILTGERLEKLTRETADTITKESVRVYGREIRKDVSRKAFLAAAAVLLTVAALLWSMWPVKELPSGFTRTDAELAFGSSSEENVDVPVLKVTYDLNGEERGVVVSLVTERVPVGLTSVRMLGYPVCTEGEWSMKMAAYCDLKSEDRFQVVLTIVVQERDKDHPTTVTEIFNVTYRDGTYSLTE